MHMRIYCAHIYCSYNTIQSCYNEANKKKGRGKYELISNIVLQIRSDKLSGTGQCCHVLISDMNVRIWIESRHECCFKNYSIILINGMPRKGSFRRFSMAEHCKQRKPNSQGTLSRHFILL